MDNIVMWSLAMLLTIWPQVKFLQKGYNLLPIVVPLKLELSKKTL